MNIKRALSVPLMALCLLLTEDASAGLEAEFAHAIARKDRQAMAALAAAHREQLPGLISSLVDSALAAGHPSREGRLYLAEEIASAYREATGDIAPLREVKKRSFDSRLSEPVRPEAAHGPPVVEIRTAGHGSGSFVPDNIIIKAGQTVKWVNTGGSEHTIASTHLIGKAGMHAPKIPPDHSWRFLFTRTGDYYYICVTHKGMLGKVTVED